MVRNEYVFFIYLFPRTPQNFKNLINKFINTSGVTIKKLRIHAKINKIHIPPKNDKGKNSLPTVYSKKRDIIPISL